jgi:carbamoyltransferase
MICLGISEDFFDAGVTLCDGPRVLYAANEERFTRRKNEGGFPRQSLAALFAYTGVAPKDVERVYVSGLMTPPLPVRMFPRLHEWMFDAQRSKQPTWFKRLMEVAMFMTPISHTSEDSLLRRAVRPLLAPVTRRALPAGLRRVPIQFVEHHHAHAAGAWRCSGFDEALCVTADGMGDGLSLTVSRAKVGQGIERLWKAASHDSFGLFFEAMTGAFGFTPCRDEGKLTGLAACGRASNVHEPSPFHLEQGRLEYHGPRGGACTAWIRDELRTRYSREDLCAWAQDLLESNLVEIARWWLRDTGLRHMAVAGGVFANVKLNQRLHEIEEADQVFVYPNMGDGGLSYGAICSGQGFAPEPVSDVFWGDGYTDTDIETALGRAGLTGERCDDPESRVGDLLAEGRIVGRFQGRMEWGPRALGNRSILARTTDRVVVDQLNHLLLRSDFMPFAPAMLDEDAGEYLLGVGAARHAAEFMTVCFNCTDKMRREHPAVVHVDGTARSQLVRADRNPGFHRILKRFKEHSGAGVVLNTSFNIHEEPIIRTPDEAIAAFLKARLDYLSIGPFLVRGPHGATVEPA